MSHMSEKVDREVQSGGIEPAKGRCIPILTPTLGRVTMPWADQRSKLLFPMNCGRYPFTMQDKAGGEIAEVRNAMVEFFLALKRNSPGAEFPGLFWLDDDVIPCSPAILIRLIGHERPIASGVYFTKMEPGEPLIFPGGSSGTTPFRPGEVFESWGWAQGLCWIELGVYERMRDELDLGVDKYGNPAWYKTPEFGVDTNGALILGGTEDFVFFDNASKLGYRPLVDCDKHAFGWHIDLKTLQGYPMQQFDQWSRQQPMVWPSKGGRPEVCWK